MNGIVLQTSRRSAKVSTFDRAYRALYRVGFGLLRLWWYVRRPNHQGALVALWFSGKILMIRQSYRDVPSWPGGGIRRGETPTDAALRELREELGLVFPRELLRLAMEVKAFWDFQHDHVWIFELKLSEAPILSLDNREVVDACFLAPETVLTLPVSPFIRRYLAETVPVG